MGREVKRVSLDFDWPDSQVWKGFLNPFGSARHECTACDGSGYNPETKQISDDWYDFAGTGRRWVDNITQGEVDALISENRLWDFWRRIGPNGWEDIEPRPVVTAEMVNAANRKASIHGHDAINRMICVKTRASRLGVYGHCVCCGGEGDIWESDADREAYDAWEPTEPPAGEGWQLWETVSEGSPVTPVFATPEELARHLAGGGGHPIGRPPTYEQALAFVGEGWAPSLIGSPEHGIESGVVAVGRTHTKEGDR